MGRAGVAAVACGLALAAFVAGARAAAQPKPAPNAAADDGGAGQRDAQALDGATVDYASPADGSVPPERGWLGRAFVHRLAAVDPGRPLPILVFLHGVNAEQIKFRWMGGGREGDVRRIAAELMEAGKIPPMLVAAPSVVLPAATAVARTSWPGFDLDAFLATTAERLHGIATLDRHRVIVAGHSGGGCNKDGGIVTAVHARAHVHAALMIDACMDVDTAAPLARARPATHVIVSWQTMSWAKRPFTEFRRAFLRAIAERPPDRAVVRELEQLQPTAPMPHDAMVALVLRRWLPPLLAPDAAPSIPCVSP